MLPALQRSLRPPACPCHPVPEHLIEVVDDATAGGRRLPAAAREVLEIVDAAAVLARARSSMGGASLDRLQTVEYDVVAHHWDQGQAREGFHRHARYYAERTARIAYDYAGGLRLRSKPRPIYPLQWKWNCTEVISGGRVGWRKGKESVTSPWRGALSDIRIASRLKVHRMACPDVLLRCVFSSTESLSARRVEEGGTCYLAVTKDWHGAPLTLYLDQTTGLPSHVEVTEDLPVQGDVVSRVDWEGWTEVAGVWLPARVLHTYDSVRVEEETRSAFELDTGVEFRVPAKFHREADPAATRKGHHRARFYLDFTHKGFTCDAHLDGPPLKPALLADGVLFLEGELYNTMFVDLGESLAMIEAPFTPEWTEAALLMARDHFGDKPVSHVVLSHLHYDHVAGVRALIARGATVVTPSRYVAAHETFAGATKSLLPDALSGGGEATIVGVGDHLKISSSGGQSVEVHVVSNQHACELALVHVPGAEVMFVTDLYSPTFPPTKGFGSGVARFFFGALFPRSIATLVRDARDFIAAMEQLGLEPATLVGGHGPGTAEMREARLVASIGVKPSVEAVGG